MNLPARDYITGKEVSVVQRENYNLAARQAQQNKLSSEQFKQLNKTTSLIAAANAELVEIQNRALQENTRQTAILDTQLQIAKINELEKNRQNQIKQAAFALSKRVQDIKKIESLVLKHVYCLDELNQVDAVGLTSDAPNEINDKQYVHDILSELQNLFDENKKSLSNTENDEINNYLSNIKELDEAIFLKNNLESKLVKQETQAIPNKYQSWLKKVFAPKFVDNNILNIIIIIIYYTNFIPFILGFCILIIMAVDFIFKKIKDNNGKKEDNIQDLNNNEVININERILKLQNIITTFKNKHKIN